MICEVCGNDYDKAFQVTSGGKTMTFDSFECAIMLWRPRRALRGRDNWVHVEAPAAIYCCAHCASADDEQVLKDRK
jgi:hypothetical protein